jgi:hypothetical protein
MDYRPFNSGGDQAKRGNQNCSRTEVTCSQYLVVALGQKNSEKVQGILASKCESHMGRSMQNFYSILLDSTIVVNIAT